MPKSEPRYWIFKTEPSAYSIDDLKKDKKIEWSGVRNYQVRNFLRDDMEPGDLVLLYHSSIDDRGIAGMAKISSKALPDGEQFEKRSHHYDPKSKKENPIWISREISFQKKLKRIILLTELKREKALKNLRLLQKGSRLSITPLTKNEFETVLSLE